MKKQLIYLLVICFSLSLLAFGLHHHEEGEIDDSAGHIGVYASSGAQQVVLRAISNDGTGNLGSYASHLSGFIPPDNPQINTPAYKVLLIFLEDTSAPAFFLPQTFSGRAPPAL